MSSLAWCARASAGPALFAEVTSTWLPASACTPGSATGCSSHDVSLVDLDGDRALDLVFASGGGAYDDGAAEPSKVFLQRMPGSFTDVTASLFGGFSSRVRRAPMGDVDGDGSLDVAFPGAFGLDGDRLFRQLAAGSFTQSSGLAVVPGQSSTASAAQFGDLDDDGDLDFVVADWGPTPGSFLNGTATAGAVRVYFNDGMGKFTVAPPGTLPPAPPASISSDPMDVDLLDVNGDMRLDLFITSRNGASRLLINNEMGQFSDAPVPAKRGPYSFHADACDIDGDGDLDLVLDDSAGDLGPNHRTQILVNDGAGDLNDQSGARIVGEPSTDDRDVRCADVDGDGDLDLVVATVSGLADKVLLNDGSGIFTFDEGALPARNGAAMALDLGDIDRDGRLDIVTAAGESATQVNRVYLATGAVAPDHTPPVFREIETPAPTAGAPTVMRLAVRDSHTSAAGQALVAVSVAWDPGSGPTNSVARFMGGDVWRAVIPPQTEGTMLSLTASATDRVGLSTTADAIVVTVGPMAAAGAGGAAGGADMGAAGDVAQAGSTNASGGSASAGSPSSGDSGSDSSGGCATGRSANGLAALFCFCMTALIFRCRRRQID